MPASWRRAGARPARARQYLAQPRGRAPWWCASRRHGVIVGRGWTQPGGRPHAETEALRRAGPAARGATLYATLEPCSHYGKTPPCTDAIIAAGISRVVSAIEDPNAKVAGRGHACCARSGIAVEVGVRRRGGAPRPCGPHPAHLRRPAPCDAQARGFGRRQGRARRPPPGCRSPGRRRGRACT